MAAGGGATALHAAASAGHLAIVEALIQAGADVDIQVTSARALSLWMSLASVCKLGCQALPITRRMLSGYRACFEGFRILVGAKWRNSPAQRSGRRL